MHVSIATEISDELVAAFARLMPQLTTSGRVPTAAQVAEIIASPATDLFVCRDSAAAGAILGVATLVAVRIPTSVRCIVEDVVVDDAARGRGAGEALLRAMIDRARARGATAVDLTSHPDRAAANRLYQRLGFALRTTNPYRLKL
jgi:ribosomal protein S18 acetylase RimI-like enzyme